MTNPYKGLSPKEAAKLFGRKPQPSPRSDSNESGPIFEKTRINNLLELKNLIKRLQPSANTPNAPIIVDTKKANMADETFSGIVTIPQSGGQSTLRQTILDGFEIIKNHQKFHRASMATRTSLEEYGGYPPAIVPDPSEHIMWIDTFIDRNMGGKREGLYITWELPEGKFRLDPWSCELEKIDGS